MHDIRFIRDHPGAFDAGLKRRFFPDPVEGGSWSTRILALDEKVRAAVAEKQAAETVRNQSSKLIGKAKGSGDEAEASRLMAEVAEAKQTIERAGEAEAEALKARDDLLLSLPNLPYDDIPDGEDEAANEEVRIWGEPRKFNYEPRPHDDLGLALAAGTAGPQMDFEAAARMSGSRFVALRGPIARLERALAAFMLDLQTEEHGYKEVSPPFLVRDKALVGTTQLPKFEEDLFSGWATALPHPHRRGAGHQSGSRTDPRRGPASHADDGPHALFPFGGGQRRP